MPRKRFAESKGHFGLVAVLADGGQKSDIHWNRIRVKVVRLICGTVSQQGLRMCYSFAHRCHLNMLLCLTSGPLGPIFHSLKPVTVYL